MDGRRGLKERRLRSMTKCHICGKKFMTVQALRAHETVHRTRAITKNKLGSRVAKQKGSILQRKLLVEPTDTPKKSVKSSKVEFECPKCSETFKHYFQAFKHIQKTHCIDNKGEPVSSDSPHIIKPVLIEKCLKCNMLINADPHSCQEKDSVCLYKCLGCSQTHYNLYYFDQHLSRMHSEGVESMFFPSESEFLSWKQHMEAQTRAVYSSVKDHNEKQIYKCQCQDTVEGTKLICPSSIITQKFANGIQVHFYQKHFSHSVRAYHVGVQFKKYSITNFVKVNSNKTKLKDSADGPTNEDLYIQLKNVMEGIIKDAANVNITSLKVLLEKAYEMTLILNNYKEVKDQDVPMDRPLLDDQITLALEDRNTLKPDHALSNLSGETIEEVIDNYTENAVKVKRKAVDFKKEVEEVTIMVAEKVDDEQETPTPSPMVTSTPKPKTQALLQSPSSFNDSYKNFVDVNFKMTVDNKPTTKSATIVPKVAPTQKKKQIVKTKMGQFKPSLSPKKSLSPIRKKRVDSKVKFNEVADVEYEVKERENDCNILILKI